MSMAFDVGATRLSDTDLFGVPVIEGHKSVLAQTFEYPPFSVLNAREGWWQTRKRQWLALGIQSELGRGGGNTSASARAMELAGGFRPVHGTHSIGERLA